MATPENITKIQFLMVTGLSGAGKNVVMSALEDLGFYCVDNLPIPLISTFFHFSFHSQAHLLKVALGVDARGGEKFLKDFMREVDQLRSWSGLENNLKIIFLQASNNTLVRRFEETRRRHPLSRGCNLSEAIKKEKALLRPIMDLADTILDTDTFNLHELRRWVRNSFADTKSQEVLVNLTSFGFKYGMPPESNLVYDVRFLPNPYFIPALKKIDGRQKEVQEFLFDQKEVVEYWERLSSFLKYALQKYFEEGRPFVNVAIGCTGGRHRSVAIVERIAQEKWDNVTFLIHHRDAHR